MTNRINCSQDGFQLSSIKAPFAYPPQPETSPKIIAALGQALPKYRWQLTWRAIVSAATTSAAIALVPLPMIDFIPLVATQSMMVLAIARIYNYQITLERARVIMYRPHDVADDERWEHRIEGVEAEPNS